MSLASIWSTQHGRGDGIFHCPVQNIVVLGGYAVAPTQYSLFSPLSRSLARPPGAVARQAHDLLLGSWKGKAHRSKKRKTHHEGVFSFFVLYSQFRCHGQNVATMKPFRNWRSFYRLYSIPSILYFAPAAALYGILSHLLSPIIFLIL